MHTVPPVAFALKQVIEEGMTDVLPAIRELSVSESLSAGPVRKAIEQFVTTRGAPLSSGHFSLASRSRGSKMRECSLALADSEEIPVTLL